MSSPYHHRKSLDIILFLCVFGLILSICFLGMGGCASPEQRAAGEEEYGFFRDYVGRNGVDRSEAELEEAALRSLNEFSALCRIGNELGIYEPYSFEQMKQDCARENEERARKKQTGEGFYGPDSLSLESYFQYFQSTLQADVLTVLLDQRDTELISEARSYYDQNREIFTRTASVSCRITENGITKEYTFQREKFKSLGQSDPMLMDFLSSAENGDEAVLGEGKHERRVRRLDAVTELLDFSFYEREIVEVYLTQEWLPQRMEEIIRKEPIVF